MSVLRLFRERGSRSRRRHLLLLLIVIVAVVAGVSGFLIFLSPAVVPELRFYVLKDTYRLGENVESMFENRHTLSFCHGGGNPWEVYRFVNDTWERVEVHEDFAAFYLISPGESRRWTWKAENDPERAQFGLAEVVPGPYRVQVAGALARPYPILIRPSWP